MADVDAGALAPVAPVVPAAPAAPAPSPTAGEGGPTPEVGNPPAEPKTFTEDQVEEIVQKRLARASRKGERETRAEMERRIRAETELEILRKQGGERQPQPKGKPRIEDFKDKTPEDYFDALADWKLEQSEAKRQAETRKEREAREAKEEGEYVTSKLSEAAEKYPDLDVRLSELPDLTRPMLDFVIETDHGPAVGDFIANNPAEAHRIAKLSPARQVLAMHEIASKLTAAPKPSAAPPPIVPNAGTGAKEKGYRPDMTDKEYADLRKRQLAQRNR